MKELNPLIDELAKAYSKDKKCEVDEAKKQIEEKLASSESKAHGATVSSLCCSCCGQLWV